MAKKKKETPSAPTDGATQEVTQQNQFSETAEDIAAGENAYDESLDVDPESDDDVQQIVDSLPQEVKDAVVVEDLQKVLERESEMNKAHALEFKEDADGKTVDVDSVVPDEAAQAAIDRVLEAGTEFKPMHEKLKTLFDRVRADVQFLKDDVFKVRQGSAGVEVLIHTDKGNVLMDWETFCLHAFGVSTKRINQLLEIKDKEHGTTVKQSPKISVTKDDYQAALDEAFEAGKQAANEPSDETVSGVIQQLEQTLTQVTPVADKSYEYFHQFKDEPETYATELSAMLIEHGLELSTIERIAKLMLKDAKKTLCDLAVKAVAA